MPELPDVERFRRHLDETVLGCRVAGGEVADKRILLDIGPRQLLRGLEGCRLVRSRRHGKHLLVDLDRESGWLVMHFGMTGYLQAIGADRKPPDFWRVRLDMEGGQGLAYVSRRLLGHVGLVEDDRAFLRGCGLGPDALDGLDTEAFVALLSGRRGQVKSALMNQDLMAGIGNVYSDEILFQAGIHPRRSLERMDRAALERLHEVLRAVLQTAIDRGAGSEDFLDRLPRDYLLAHRRAGGRCPRCGGGLQTVKSAGRTAYFCPACQPASSRM